MAELIKNRGVFDDPWKTVRLAEDETASTVRLGHGPLLVPLSVWLERRDQLFHREWAHGTPLGLWLEPHENPAAIAGDVRDFAVIAVHFPEFTDGRGYSIAMLLRTRYGYTGELRAVGDVGPDQLYDLARVGFDSFAVSEPHAALSGLGDFSDVDHGAVNRPVALLRRLAVG